MTVRALRAVVPFYGPAEVCTACGGRRSAHRDTPGRWVGCNRARLASLDTVHLRLRHTLLRCVARPQAFGVDVADDVEWPHGASKLPFESR